MNLDEYQLSAVVNEDDKVLLIAPPGSGKTTVLLEKIERLLNSKYKAEKIVVLTFSKGAAINMRERFKKKYETAPFFGTVHSYCYRMIRKYKKYNLKKEGLSDRNNVNKSQNEEIRIITSFETVAALEKIRLKYSLSRDDMERFYSLVPSLSEISVIKEKSQEENLPEKFLQEINDAYIDYKKQKNLMDFDDLEHEFLTMLEDEKILCDITNSIDYVLVDEFQDLNEIQLRIIKLISKKSKVFCVGDEDQCIYAFRGSSTITMINFEDYFPMGKKLFLKYNYRSAKTVTSAANIIISENICRNKKMIIAKREEVSSVKHIIVNDENEEYQATVRFIREALERGEDIAILYRINSESLKLSQYLFRESIEFSFLDRGYSPYDSYYIKDMISFLNVAYFDSISDFGRIFRKTSINTPTSLYEKILNINSRANFLENSNYLEESDSMKNEKTNELENTMEKKETKRGEGPLRKIRDLLKILIGEKYITSYILELPEKLRKDLSIEEYYMLKKIVVNLASIKKVKFEKLADYILYGIGYMDYLINKETDLSVIKKEIIEFIEEVKSFGSYENFYKFYRGYTKFIKASFKGERVTLGTLHSVKGMEFDNVAIINVCDGIIPHERSLKDLEAERRLFYVGVTRSKKNVLLISPKYIGGRSYKESQFIKNVNFTEL